MIKQNSIFRIAWDSFSLLFVFVSCALIPFQIAFQRIPFKFGTELIFFLDVFFLIDIALNFFTSYSVQGIEVTNPRETAIHYLQTFFIIDFIANIPFELLLGGQDVLVYNISLALILRLFRLLRLVRLFVRWEKLSWINPGYLRITKFLTFILLLVHWIACAWFLSAFVENFPEDSWVVSEGIRDADSITQYIRSLYWTITTMTTVGYGDISPKRPIEYILAMFVMLLGASIYAFIIGNIASLFSSLNAAKANYWNHMEAVIQYLRHRRVPNALSEKVQGYYEYLWAQHRGLHESAFFNDLPGPLRLEVLLHLTRELLEHVPLFKYCPPALRDELLLALKPQTYAPEGYIVREGEVGREIYFISQGSVEIMSDSATVSHGTLEGGEYFGDLSMLLGEKRSACVKALTYCEIFTLTKEDFNRIRKEYPEFKNVLKKMSSEKSEKLAALTLDGVVL